MSWVLHIDTSMETAAVIIAQDEKIISTRENENQKDHAAFLEPAIQSTIKEAGLKLTDLAAIAVVNGPGSYTGLRVGMASAKGLCFALNKPLILLNSLEILAIAALENCNLTASSDLLYCPMIDARRMEVYTAVYDAGLNVIKIPQALILNADSYNDLLMKKQVFFFGNGSDKWKTVCRHKNARFINVSDKQNAIVKLSTQRLDQQVFSSVAYSEPFYIKEFHSGINPPRPA